MVAWPKENTSTDIQNDVKPGYQCLWAWGNLRMICWNVDSTNQAEYCVYHDIKLCWWISICLRNWHLTNWGRGYIQIVRSENSLDCPPLTRPKVTLNYITKRCIKERSATSKIHISTATSTSEMTLNYVQKQRKSVALWDEDVIQCYYRVCLYRSNWHGHVTKNDFTSCFASYFRFAARFFT